MFKSKVWQNLSAPFRRHDNRIDAKDVKWVVNDRAQLGVEVNGQVFFFHKGQAEELTIGESGPGVPILYRPVGRYEFGSYIRPQHMVRTGRVDLPYLSGYIADPPCPERQAKIDWRPLPTFKGEWKRETF